MTKTDGINNLFDVMKQAGFKVSDFNKDDNTFVATTVKPDKEFKGMLVLNNRETEVKVLLEDNEGANHSFFFVIDLIEGVENFGVSTQLLKIKYDTKLQRRLEKEKAEALNTLSDLQRELRRQSVDFNNKLKTVKEELEVLRKLQDTYESVGGDLGFYEGVKQNYVLSAKNFIESLEEE